jgi:isopentenyldiphosphate isomerase
VSYLAHIAMCNRHDFANFVPLRAAGAEVGWLRPRLAEALRDVDPIFVRTDEGLHLDDRLEDFDARSATVARAVERLAAEAVLPPVRGELYPAAPHFMAPPLFQIDRGAVPSFGVRAYGVHVNGFVKRNDGGLDLWIGRRAPTQKLCPDMLDNMVAGGLPIGITPIDNVVKEAHEEAAVPQSLAHNARLVSTVRYIMETDEGLRRDTLFCYDLELPPDFTPENTDGEVAEFRRMAAEEVKDIVRDTYRFKFNCNLVVLDFLIRHGLLTQQEVDLNAVRKGMGQTHGRHAA